MTKQGVYDEEDWTDVNSNITSYLKSKTLAEKAAWDFVKGMITQSRSYIP